MQEFALMPFTRSKQILKIGTVYHFFTNDNLFEKELQLKSLRTNQWFLPSMLLSVPLLRDPTSVGVKDISFVRLNLIIVTEIASLVFNDKLYFIHVYTNIFMDKYL